MLLDGTIGLLLVLTLSKKYLLNNLQKYFKNEAFHKSTINWSNILEEKITNKLSLFSNHKTEGGKNIGLLIILVPKVLR